MSEQIKLPEELLMEIQKLRDELTANVVRVGRLNIEAAFHRKDLEIIETEINSLYDYAEDISLKESDLQKKVTDQFGNGKLDFESGIFTKAEDEFYQKYAESLSVEDLVKIYNKAHCLVYPTNGEGFGLIPFQGIATGLPTIVTNATACADFAEMSVPLDSRPSPGNGVHLGDWVEPDLDDLRDKMKYVYENFNDVKEKTLHSASVIHSTQTWNHIGQKIVDIFGEKINEMA
jgi:glycosyltransferase involved in cell wall biosynthesis